MPIPLCRQSALRIVAREGGPAGARMSGGIVEWAWIFQEKIRAFFFFLEFRFGSRNAIDTLRRFGISYVLSLGRDRGLAHPCLGSARTKTKIPTH